MGLTIKRGYNFIEVIGINTLVSISSKLLLIGLVFLIMVKTLFQKLCLFRRRFEKGLSFFLREGGGIDVEMIASFIHMVLPAAVFIASLFDTVLNFYFR